MLRAIPKEHFGRSRAHITETSQLSDWFPSIGQLYTPLTLANSAVETMVYDEKARAMATCYARAAAASSRAKDPASVITWRTVDPETACTAASSSPLSKKIP